MHCRKLGIYPIASTALLLASIAAGAQQKRAEQIHPETGGKPQLEMVFVLDTTGSMGGLIDGAKQKIWSIVNDVMKTPQHPKVKIGLVAYRDHGDAYVTKVLPITDDLDKVYSTLMEYQAAGGGDTPEDVRQALADGVHKAGWSPRGPRVAQILFLVGDAPPHDDYAQEPDTLTSTGEAVKNGIIVNTIECGGAEDTRVAWQKICQRGEGKYFQIAQDGGVQAISTPFDAELSHLGSKVGATYFAYGGGGMAGGGAAFRASKAKAQSSSESHFYAAAPAGGLADRAVNKAINARAYDDNDLLQAVENGTVKLETIKSEDLPDELRKLSPEARKKEVDRRLAERKDLKSQILVLSKKRDAYIAQEKQKKSPARSGFDTAVSAAIRAESARRGIKF
jgi:Mg-chelatase subunit ChlD